MAGKGKQNDPDKRIEDLAHRSSTLGWWLEVRNTGQDDVIDRDVERSCERKDRYETPESARAVAAMNGMADALYTYECRYCLHWHLTRRPTKGQPKKK